VVSDSATQTGPGAAPGGRPPGCGTALPLRAGSILLSESIDLYMTRYAGRDSSRVQRLAWWSATTGHRRLEELSDDDIFSALQALANQPSRYFAGLDTAGQQVFKARGRPLAAATINRYSAALAAVLTWAIKHRIAPKGYVHPCRSVERKQENNEKTRFLSDDERQRLLQACRQSKWPRLYLLVLLALTTGARKGELLGLQWADVDLERCLAHCGRKTNLALLPTPFSNPAA
jgi:integrase